jgi:single-strand DNA-binding protein
MAWVRARRKWTLATPFQGRDHGELQQGYLVGNLTRDPQVRYTPGGKAVAEIGLAVNRTWYDKQANQRKEDVTFIDVTLWDRQAEIAGEYLSKGRSVLIEGRLQLDQWEDKNTGEKRSKLRVVGEVMQMLGGRGEGGGDFSGSGSGPRRSAPASTRGNRQQEPSPTDSFYDDAGPEHIPSDDVPF